MSTTEYAITGSISVLNLLLHLLGGFLLWKTYNWTTIKSQQLILFNLSVCEGLESIVWVIIHILEFIGDGDKQQQKMYATSVHISLSQVLMMLMMALTLDRLMAVVLGLKYPQYWTVKNTKKLLIGFWCVGIAFLLLSIPLGPWFRRVEALYFTLAQSCLFIIVAFVTYATLFWRYVKSRNALRQYRDSNAEDLNGSHSIAQTFLESRFYVSILIILSYLVFSTIPFAIIIISKSVSEKGNFKRQYGDGATFMSVISMHLSYTADAVIYIFLQKDVREKLFKTMSCSNEIESRSNQQEGFQTQPGNGATSTSM